MSTHRWSKLGIVYYLMQKHCDCSSNVPGCCDSDWRITLAGSRALRSAETRYARYAPVEGESLAVVWSLEQTRYFTQGCHNLLVLTDLKPLCKLLGDRILSEIQNPQLLHLKEKTLRWWFRIKHGPGKQHYVADATSRKPLKYDGDVEEIEEEDVSHDLAYFSTDDSDDSQDEDTTFVNTVVRRYVDKMKIQAVTWECIKLEMEGDTDMRGLSRIVIQGFPIKRQEMPL